jgi:hypothetical protein
VTTKAKGRTGTQNWERAWHAFRGLTGKYLAVAVLEILEHVATGDIPAITYPDCDWIKRDCGLGFIAAIRGGKGENHSGWIKKFVAIDGFCYYSSWRGG